MFLIFSASAKTYLSASSRASELIEWRSTMSYEYPFRPLFLNNINNEFSIRLKFHQLMLWWQLWLLCLCCLSTKEGSNHHQLWKLSDLAFEIAPRSFLLIPDPCRPISMGKVSVLFAYQTLSHWRISEFLFIDSYSVHTIHIYIHKMTE